ncbi:MAG: MGMT family protein [Planctomycetota bacterium]
MTSGTYEHIYAIVRQIPEGRVATYGQVASLAHVPGHARQVGYALSALPETNDVPWQRVINAKGEISQRGFTGDASRQRPLLEAEGVLFDEHGRVPLARYRWEP